MENYKDTFKAKIKKVPLSIALLVFLICLYGFSLLYSAAGGNVIPWAYKQIITFCIFMPIALLIAIVDIKIIYKLAYIFYAFTLALLVLVHFFGKSAMGATRWLDLGIFSIQPSELVKIALVLLLARYFHDNQNKNSSDFFYIMPAIASIIPIALVIKQPDLGTGMITLMVVILMFVYAGIRLRYLVLGAISGVILAPVIWFMLHDYQRNRILTFINPERDPLGAGYNIIQSKIAIGSGGLFGKGLFSGTQSHLSFLPEYQTDFIFSFLAEELGFIGGIILLILYSMLIFKSSLIAINCKSKFAFLMASGTITLFFCHVFINIAMVMGLLPVVGLPLPLVSYGRTVMVSMLIGFGLIMNAAVNQRTKIL